MLWKMLALEEALPTVDSFVLYETCLHATLHEDLISAAFDTHRGVMAKTSRPMPIGHVQVDALYEKYLAEAPPPPQGIVSKKASFTMGRASVSEKMLRYLLLFWCCLLRFL